MSNNNLKCYAPDGQAADDHVPCSSDEFTACCNSGSLCLENGFCLPFREPYALYRGTCSNQKWTQGCPEYCNGRDDPYYLQFVEYDYDQEQNIYCCTKSSEDSSSCNSSNSFWLPDDGVLYRGVYVTNRTAFDAPDPKPSQCNSTKPDPSDSPQCEPGSSNSSPSRDIVIGVGVGVPLGVLMLACLAWALFERRARLALRDMSAAAVGAGARLEATSKPRQRAGIAQESCAEDLWRFLAERVDVHSHLELNSPKQTIIDQSPEGLKKGI